MKLLSGRGFWSIIIVVLALGGSRAQQEPHLNNQAIEVKLFDAPSATFKLEALAEGRGFELCNHSSRHINRFRKGCVKKKAGQLLIVEQRAYLEADLAPRQNVIQCRVWTAFHGAFPDEQCKQGQLAVIEVEFADGAQWKLKP